MPITWNDPDLEVRSYTEIVERFGSRAEDSLCEITLDALFRKARVLEDHIGNLADAVRTYEMIAKMFDVPERPRYLVDVARASVEKARTLEADGQLESAWQECEKVRSRFENTDDDELVRVVSEAGALIADIVSRSPRDLAETQ
jgi:hypothetical protein